MNTKQRLALGQSQVNEVITIRIKNKLIYAKASIAQRAWNVA